jgi:site-specific DNA-methyltransferase (adenine-specific)
MKIDLHLGDCLEYMRTIPDESIDCVVTDPPFAFAGGLSNGRSSIADDQFFLYWWKDVCEQLDRILKPTGEGFIWCDWRTAAIIAKGFNIGQTYNWRVSQMIYHYREMPGQGQPFRSSVDMIAYCRGEKSKGGRIPNTTHNLISKYWYYGKHENHPAEKDPEIVKQLLEWCSDEGMKIIDPFMGSGTTGVACKLLKRDFVGCEIDPKYFEIAEKRIRDATIQAELFEKQAEIAPL